MASTIGIKIANGEFYSLVEENSAVKKRLVLTTVHNKQRNVQIDLYRSFTKTMADAQYIGSLVVENIKSKPKGDPSIEMIIASTIDGEIIAEAVDLDASGGGQRQSLNVSLKSLDEDSRDFELPDFDLEQHEPPPQGLYEKAEAIQKKKSKSFPWLLLILIILGLLIAGGLVVWYFVFDAKVPGGIPFLSDSQPVSAPAAPSIPSAAPAQIVSPPLAQPAQPAAPAASTPAQPAAPPTQPVQSAPPPAQPAAPPVIQAPVAPASQTPSPVNRTRPAPPVASYKVPATIPREGVAYKIRWGDTLWDISEAFYRNPWLYPRIARFNNIPNPDFIISGRTIRIPPRN